MKQIQSPGGHYFTGPRSFLGPKTLFYKNKKQALGQPVWSPGVFSIHLRLSGISRSNSPQEGAWTAVGPGNISGLSSTTAPQQQRNLPWAQPSAITWQKVAGASLFSKTVTGQEIRELFLLARPLKNLSPRASHLLRPSAAQRWHSKNTFAPSSSWEHPSRPRSTNYYTQFSEEETEAPRRFL